jgi:hypothetical protein
MRSSAGSLMHNVFTEDVVKIAGRYAEGHGLSGIECGLQ